MLPYDSFRPKATVAVCRSPALREEFHHENQINKTETHPMTLGLKY